MNLQLIDDGNNNLPIASAKLLRKFKFNLFSCRLFRAFVIATLPLYAIPSLAYTFPVDPSAPSILKTTPTGTGIGTAAKNHVFLTDTFEGFNTVGISYTTPSTP